MNHVNQSLRVLIACALGAWIGSLVALQIAHRFWYVGLLVGFVTGYLALEFKTVIAAVGTAFKGAAYEVLAYRPDRKVWKLRFMTLGYSSFLIATSTASLILFYKSQVLHNLVWKLTMPEGQVTPFAMIVCVVFVMIPGIVGLMTFWGGIFPIGTSKGALNWARFGARWANPLGLVIGPLVVTFYLVPRECYLFVRRHGKIACKSSASFTKKFFLLVHSQARLLCGTDAAIGALIGYLCGNAIIGAIAGGLIGFFNFEIVSIRMLKCVPATRSLFN